MFETVSFRSAIALAVALLFYPKPVCAAAPANDFCSGAEVIPASGPFPFLSTMIDARDATTNSDPIPSCPINCVSRTVWYRFIPAATALYTLSCGTDTATTVQDSVMAVYTASAPCSEFTEVACADDTADRRAAISMQLNAGTLYYILVGISEPFLPFDPNTAIQLKVSKPTVPANDLCSGAETIPATGPFPYLTGISDNTLATTIGDPPFPSCANHGQRSLWYRFTPDVSAAYTFSVSGNTATTTYDTLIGIYTSSGGCGGPYVSVACNDDVSASDFRSSVTAMLNSNTTYYVVIWAWDAPEPYIPGETSVQVRVLRQLPPAVVTIPATDITSTGAVLNAVINPNDAMTKAWFDWGATTNYGSSTGGQNLIGSANLYLAVQISAPAMTYHFRAAASNYLGVSYGTDQMFAWNAAPIQIGSFVSSNGDWHLQFNGTQNQIYLIQFSTNLFDWVPLGRATESSGILTFDDTRGIGFGSGFYRVVSP